MTKPSIMHKKAQMKLNAPTISGISIAKKAEANIIADIKRKT